MSVAQFFVDPVAEMLPALTNDQPRRSLRSARSAQLALRVYRCQQIRLVFPVRFRTTLTVAAYPRATSAPANRSIATPPHAGLQLSMV